MSLKDVDSNQGAYTQLKKCSKEPDLEKVADSHYSACHVKLD